MQNLKHKFSNPDYSRLSTLQSCVRLNDISLVGDGTHLTYFEMLGTFSFGNNDYGFYVDLWSNLLSDLKIKIDCVHVHPQSNLHHYWNYPIVEDEECVWSDGDIGGYCSELYSNGVEIGNLVNPLGHSVDVGFGWERLVSIVEGVSRVDQSSLFDQRFDPVTRDHVRTLTSFWEQGITPGNKGRNYICRKLLRKINVEDVVFQEWVDGEKVLKEKCLERGRKLWKRHKDKSPEWWWETCGIDKEDLE